MMTVQSIKPKRSKVAKREKYSEYRAELRADFNGSCGYCDDNDAFVDRSCFHIDHFAPQKPFEHLRLEYENLVYSCRFCNNRKRNHWVGDDPTTPNDGERGFVDPCNDEYEEHLLRLDTGEIVAQTKLGSYMITHLNLSLLRHQVLWNARKARRLREEIKPLIVRYRASGLPKSEVYSNLLDRYFDLTEEIDRYELLAVDN